MTAPRRAAAPSATNTGGGTKDRRGADPHQNYPTHVKREIRVRWRRWGSNHWGSRIYQRHDAALKLIERLTDGEGQKKYGTIRHITIEERPVPEWGTRIDLSEQADSGRAPF